MKCARSARVAGLLLGFAGGVTPCHADTYPRQPVDVLHYGIEIDFGPRFAYDATMTVDVRALEGPLARLHLDLEGPTVSRVTSGGQDLSWRHEGGRLKIDLDPPLVPEARLVVEVRYSGRPDGRALVARPNAHGEDVLFADNWPIGARRWLPTVDHPSDKAAVSFTVTAEDGLRVVAPGRLVDNRRLPDGRRLTSWSETEPIPTYCMVVGLARFEVERIGVFQGAPLSTWVFPPDAEAAPRMFDRSRLMLEFFASRLGPFPYSKLAQVQSTTRYLGMENASAIFYAETELQGPNVDEFPVAHEIAHQWWGNSVTPADWDDLWLSEGFATYFDALFYEHVDGPAALQRRMAEGTKRVLALRRGAVVDPGITDPRAKLTGIVYRKGAWVLHMLRHRLGDDAFFDGLQDFYRRYAGRNATTEDLRRVLEEHSGESLGDFFHQWLRRHEVPDLRVAWRWDDSSGEAIVEVEQLQGGTPYRVPLQIALEVDGRIERRALELDQAREVGRFALATAPTSLDVDPDTWLLHQATVTREEGRVATRRSSRRGERNR